MTKKELCKFELEALKKLGEIARLLNLIVELNIPPLNIKGLKLGSTEKAVLGLCDLRHTSQDMASELRKTPSNVRMTLTSLRRRGLVKSVRIEGKKHYIRVRR